MLPLNRSWTFVLTLFLSLFLLIILRPFQGWTLPYVSSGAYESPHGDPSKFDWSRRQQQFPVKSFHSLPQPLAIELPQIQYGFSVESREDKATRRQRRAQIKGVMQRCWCSYRLKAWMEDELTPLSGKGKTTFGGWAATLVDSLDTLWIMDMQDEFYEAVDAAMHIDFSQSTMDTISIFETNIRYLGGFISAYDLSGDKRLLNKALEVANLIYAAFDTPNRMPVPRFRLNDAIEGLVAQSPPSDAILAEIGSFSLELTRLSQLTGDMKWYDAVHRIMQIFSDCQGSTALPGMWPIQVNAETGDFSTGGAPFSLAAWADSFYEYLPKMVALLGAYDTQYARMYSDAMDTAMKYSLYKPMIKEGDDILMTGAIRVHEGQASLQPELQHLSCYAGGMFALGGRLLQNESHVNAGERLTNGCIWAYKQMRTGIMPETSNVIPCADSECKWSDADWHQAILNDAPSADKDNGTDVEEIIKRDRLPPGFSSISNRQYLLRPEAIESIFVLYRVTGNTTLQETAWTMFRSIYAYTQTGLANAAVLDVTNGTAPKADRMESFWMAETLKYFYLVFDDPENISLDDYVFNTEAHPFLRGGSKKDSSKSSWDWRWR